MSVEGDAAMENASAVVRQKLDAKLGSGDYCAKQLLEISETADQLGFNDLAAGARARVPNAKPYCATVSYKRTVRDSYNKTGSIMSIGIKGDMDEYSMFGFVNVGARSYYFSGAGLQWVYVSEPVDEGCIITTRTGSGTEKLSSLADGSLNISSDGTYGGTILIKAVKIRVEKARDLPNPDSPHECDYVTDDMLKQELEDFFLDASIEGKSDDRIHLVGSFRSPDAGSEGYSEVIESNWDIRLPDKSTGIKASN